jgi:hypothetical protein
MNELLAMSNIWKIVMRNWLLLGLLVGILVEASVSAATPITMPSEDRILPSRWNWSEGSSLSAQVIARLEFRLSPVIVKELSALCSFSPPMKGTPRARAVNAAYVISLRKNSSPSAVP